MACVFAVLSLAWAPLAYHKALRRIFRGTGNMTKAGMALYFCWRLFIISARVTAISLFATYFAYWAYVFAGIHWFIMFIWIILQEWKFSESCCEQWILNIFMALIYVFCYVGLVDGYTRLRYLVYYVVVFFENTIMILGWYMFSGIMDRWYTYPALITVFGGFFIGIMFQMVYYMKFHPCNSSSCPKDKKIQLRVSWRKLCLFKKREPRSESGEPAEVVPLSA